MPINIDISRYSGYFHDGGVINISQFNDEIEISMESNQIFPKWNPENIPLSSYETIRGKLHLKKVKNILVDNQYTMLLKMQYDSGDILDFKIEEPKKIILSLLWTNYPPKERCRVYQCIQIEAEKIYWENIPNLLDPME